MPQNNCHELYTSAISFFSSIFNTPCIIICIDKELQLQKKKQKSIYILMGYGIFNYELDLVIKPWKIIEIFLLHLKILKLYEG